ncbi:beta-lactamase class A [Scopulibacillus daqui]|uniref:Beta-lactamase class A n=1 Tax=Scopulibacillus daqui TaxID=1469162 RepID=A0ABS2Q1M3_9BACL|nr:serine hydrolase [Scopulibacillus daqui]MBM7646184.1 beta-lactamase class A [Scopulibacillus daqui]
MSLQSKLKNALKGVSGTFGIAVKHLDTGEEAQINGHELFQTASACKIAILAALFSEAEKGNLKLEERVKITANDLVPGSGVLQKFDSGLEVSVKDLATMMIIVSDNLATDKILELMGKEKVNQFTTSLALHHTYLAHSIWELLSLYAGLPFASKNIDHYKKLDEAIESPVKKTDSAIFDMSQQNNVSTPIETNILLEKIADKKIISKRACEQMIDILKSQQFGHRIPYLLPDDAITATKTGSIGGVINDAGIIYMPKNKGRFVITVFSRDNASHSEGEQAIARIAKTAYEWFAAS